MMDVRPGDRNGAPSLKQAALLDTEMEMGKQATAVLCVALLVAVVVGVDFLFFRNRFWERLLANVGIVLVFGAFYLRFLKDR